jgi:hypothetical protein
MAGHSFAVEVQIKEALPSLNDRIRFVWLRLYQYCGG